MKINILMSQTSRSESARSTPGLVKEAAKTEPDGGARPGQSQSRSQQRAQWWSSSTHWALWWCLLYRNCSQYFYSAFYAFSLSTSLPFLLVIAVVILPLSLSFSLVHLCFYFPSKVEILACPPVGPTVNSNVPSLDLWSMEVAILCSNQLSCKSRWNVLQNYKAPTGAGKPGGVGVEEAGGGWKVHLAQDNKTGLQRPSRTFSYSYTASPPVTTLTHLTGKLQKRYFPYMYNFQQLCLQLLFFTFPSFLQLQYLNTIPANIRDRPTCLWFGFYVLMRVKEQRS